jgi:hypothetical protein
MKRNSYNSNTRCTPLAVILLAIAFAAQAGAGDANPKPPVIPPHANAFGQSLAEWTIGHAQWQFEPPASLSPLLDGAECANGANGQSGPVWFLAGGGQGVVVRYCTAPAGKALFAIVSASFCSFAEGAGETEEELRACAQSWEDSNTVLILEIDGVPVPNLLRHRLQTPLFEIIWPEDNLFGLPAGSDFAVSDATAVLIPPLPKGTHTIQRRVEAEDGYISDITWHLTIE